MHLDPLHAVSCRIVETQLWLTHDTSKTIVFLLNGLRYSKEILVQEAMKPLRYSRENIS